MPWAQAARVGLAAAAPVMLAYVSIGVPAGVMASMVGVSPVATLVVSMTYYSGAGQFMVPKMVLAGQPLAAIAVTASFTNTRQVLYSAAFAPYFARVGRALTFLFGATVTDESFGVNMARFHEDATWDARAATATNLGCMLSWTAANVVGCALGPIIDLPSALMSFAMTSIFICLAVSQLTGTVTAVVMGAAAVAVLALKLVGLGNVAVLGGALIGIACGMVAAGREGGGRASGGNAGGTEGVAHAGAADASGARGGDAARAHGGVRAAHDGEGG